MLNPPLQLVGSVTLDVFRRKAMVLVRGRSVEDPEPETVQVVGNVQPILKASDTRLLPEADRSKACLKVYTRGGEMKSLKEGGNGWAADRFMWQGDMYEVMKVINYEMGVLNHYKAICMRVELT